MKTALYWEKKREGIKCRLCPHNCLIKESNYGICGERINIKGILYSENYGVITSYGIDPIEKKPLAGFMPGTKIYSIGSRGCNFKCLFCQNYSISLVKDSPFVKMSPSEVINNAMRSKLTSIAFTYNEPTVWYEFMLDTAKLAKKSGLATVCVTNGFINPEPLKELLPYIDAFNVDLKSYDEDFYRKICGGELRSVKESIEMIYGKAHLEITMLIIEKENDDIEKLEEVFVWIKSIGEDIPLHLSRYFPAYKMDNPPTKTETIVEAKKRASKYLKYVYIGNIPGLE